MLYHSLYLVSVGQHCFASYRLQASCHVAPAVEGFVLVGCSGKQMLQRHHAKLDSTHDFTVHAQQQDRVAGTTVYMVKPQGVSTHLGAYLDGWSNAIAF